MTKIKKIETKIVFYDNRKDMASGIKKMERSGWRVVSTESVDRGYNPVSTLALGVLFLPLALLGKKTPGYKVQYTTI